ncbi:MAG: ATP-binding protein [Bdellovibrionales bacterium]|nr:ATP-binding protein [Bdellovibrionales bacterium]
MVFLSGPRGAGKSLLAHQTTRTMKGIYYSWDIAQDRKSLLNQELQAGQNLWVFDELHKLKGWEKWLEQVMKAHPKQRQILIAGSRNLVVESHQSKARHAKRKSARLTPGLTVERNQPGQAPNFQRLHYSLHPLSLTEVLAMDPLPLSRLDTDPSELPPGAPIHFGTDTRALQEALVNLMTFSGFPEPFEKASEGDAKRWSQLYPSQLIREELQSSEMIQDLDRVEILFDRLSHSVGDVLSINEFRSQLQVSFITARKWIEALERVYGVFRLYPLDSPTLKSVKKEAKLYFWDWTRPSTEAARFENLMAVHLRRFCDWQNEQEPFGARFELRYFRNVHRHEVHFVVVRDGAPWIAVETTLEDQWIDPSLKYFCERVPVKRGFQVSLRGGRNQSFGRFGDAVPGGVPIQQVPGRLFLKAIP